jgi:HTH-type transcriptional regulator/antitoxin HigA
MESERTQLTEQLEEYDALRSGLIDGLLAKSLSELPTTLIKARIVKGWSQRELAEALELKEQQVQRYEAEKYASASFRRLLEVAAALSLEVSESVRLSASGGRSEDLQKADKFDWGKFPLREMYKRNWFEDFAGSMTDAEMNRELLIENFLSRVWRQPLQAFHKKHERIDTRTDEYSLVAWECRVLRLADRIKIEGSYNRERLTGNWLSGLVRLSADQNGPQLARTYLAKMGIALVLEPHLPQTYLDGAMLMSVDKRPVIGMDAEVWTV